MSSIASSTASITVIQKIPEFGSIKSYDLDTHSSCFSTASELSITEDEPMDEEICKTLKAATLKALNTQIEREVDEEIFMMESDDDEDPRIMSPQGWAFYTVKDSGDLEISPLTVAQTPFSPTEDKV